MWVGCIWNIENKIKDINHEKLKLENNDNEELSIESTKVFLNLKLAQLLKFLV